MNQEVKKMWVEALRSGEYKQGTGQLKTSENEHCCLGVLCDLYKKQTGIGEWIVKTSFNEKGENDEENGFISFSVEGGSSISVLPKPVRDWAELPDVNPYPTPKKDFSLAEINDDGASFEKIADIIEETETFYA